jgi:8-oxo-dGTP pyrophosphatase MutT (NUDIX family)
MMNPEATRTQCGALCWRVVREQVQVLLVTSRDTGRWVIPKGWHMHGMTAPAAAAREAWEEAGVEGTVEDQAIGLFRYAKVMSPTFAIPCIVTVYPLKVSKLRRRYPESGQRRRKWFTPERAAKKVDEPDLRLILQQFALSRSVPMAEPAPAVAAQS